MPEHSREMKTHVSRGLAWVGTASSLVGILDFLAILIILGLWVSPEDYGIATSAVWLYPILDQATDLGLSAAVIQRDDHDAEAISTVFWINLASATVLFVLLVIFAPIFAREFVGHEVVGWLLIAYGSKLLWQNVYFIPHAMMKKDLRFKEISVIRILANVAEFAGKVGFAAAGFGIWCFVLGPLCRVAVTGIGMQICHPWRPRFVFRLRKAWSYATFGAKSAGSQILFYFYTNIDYPIVGHYFGATALGIYKLAFEIVLEPVRVISHVIVDIAFPIFSRLRHERAKLIAQFISLVRLNLVTVMLYCAVVFVTADDLLALLFPKYTMAADAVRILCAVAVLRAVSFVVPPLLDGVGHPSRTLTYTVTAAICLPIAFVLGARLLGEDQGFLSVAWAWAIGYPIAFAVLALLAVYTLNLSVWTFVKSVSGVPACILAAGVIGELVHLAAGGLPMVARLALATVAIVGVAGLLLAYTQGLSIRGAMKSMKGEPPPPPDQGRSNADSQS